MIHIFHLLDFPRQRSKKRKVGASLMCSVKPTCVTRARRGDSLRRRLSMSVNIKSEVANPEGVESDREALLSKKKKLEQRLLEINGPPNNTKNEWKMVKTEVHWDSLLQELVRV
jgi:hypothetical protein